ncbi:MAG: hypothetical protein JOZ82_13205 [Marmoricola sp.]|nr:hypothetical protein [Marmoricola sp.]
MQLYGQGFDRVPDAQTMSFDQDREQLVHGYRREVMGLRRFSARLPGDDAEDAGAAFNLLDSCSARFVGAVVQLARVAVPRNLLVRGAGLVVGRQHETEGLQLAARNVGAVPSRQLRKLRD